MNRDITCKTCANWKGRTDLNKCKVRPTFLPPANWVSFSAETCNLYKPMVHKESK